MAITQQVRLYHDVGYIGQIAAPLTAVNRVSKINTQTDVLPFGTAVVRDGNDGIKAWGASSTAPDFFGILVRELHGVTPEGEAFGLRPQQIGGVLTFGKIYVKAGEAASAGDPVFVGTGTDVVGKFMKQAGATTTLAVKVDAVWCNDTEKDAIGVIALKIGG